MAKKAFFLCSFEAINLTRFASVAGATTATATTTTAVATATSSTAQIRKEEEPNNNQTTMKKELFPSSLQSHFFAKIGHTTNFCASNDPQ